jgi:hypothetical protein
MSGPEEQASQKSVHFVAPAIVEEVAVVPRDHLDLLPVAADEWEAVLVCLSLCLIVLVRFHLSVSLSAGRRRRREKINENDFKAVYF